MTAVPTFRGPSTVRQFLEADLVDFLHLVIVLVVLGGGAAVPAKCDVIGVKGRP